MLRYIIKIAWFSRQLVRHLARKRSGSILTTPETARDSFVHSLIRFIHSFTEPVRVYRVVDLALVGLEFLVQFVDDVVHSFVCGPVLVQLGGQLLESSFLSPHRLGRLAVPLLFRLQLHFQLVNSLPNTTQHDISGYLGGARGDGYPKA